MKPIKNEATMSHDARIAILETTISHIHETMLDIKQDIKKMDGKFDKVDQKLDALEKKMDSKFDRVDNKFDSLESRMWSNFLWTMGAIAGLFGLIAHTQTWI